MDGNWLCVVVAIGVLNDILMANGIVSTGYWSAGTVVLYRTSGGLGFRRFAELQLQESSMLKQRLIMRQTEFAEAAMKTAVAERQAAAEALTKVKLFQEAAHHLNNPLNHIWDPVNISLAVGYSPRVSRAFSG